MSWNPDDLSGFSLPGYRLIRQLGQGGMATVYLAVQESVDREVALKIMSPFLASDQSFTSRFLREARIAAQLHHPHIVTVHDVGVHETYHYIAMQYLPGGKLSELDIRQLTVDRALEIVHDIAEALSYAHSKGYVHRDVKPDNILFDENGASYLTDFGIARAADSNTQMTATGSIIGTPHYMSPEQARGRKVDHRADLYSLGIVLYELLVGEVPYQSEESLTVCIMHVNDPLPRLPRCLGALQPVLDRLLAKDPADRFEHAGALLKELDRLLADGSLSDCLGYTPATLPHVVENTTRKNTPEIRPTPRPQTRRNVSTPAGRRFTLLRWVLPLLFMLAGASWYLYDSLQRQSEQVRQEARLAQQLARLNWLIDQARFNHPPGENAKELLRRLMVEHADEIRVQQAGTRLLDAWLEQLERKPKQEELAAWHELAEDLNRNEGTLALRYDRLLRELETATPAVETKEEDAETHEWLKVVEALLQGGDFNDRLRAWTLLLQAPPGVDASQLEALQQQTVDGLRVHLQQSLDANDIDTLALRLARLEEMPELHARLDGAWWQSQLESARRIQTEQELIGMRIRQLLDEGENFLAQTRLTRPEGANARERFEQVLALDPENSRAKDGLRKIVKKLLQLVEESLKDKDYARASRYLQSAVNIGVETDTVRKAQERLHTLQRQAAKKRAPEARPEPSELPKDETALLALAEQNKRSRPELAIRAWQQVLKINPNNHEARDALARTAQALALDVEFLLEQKEMEEARQRMEWAMLADPDHPDVKAIRRKFKRASKKQTVHKNEGISQLKNIAIAQRLLKQAQETQTIDNSQQLWLKAEQEIQDFSLRQQVFTRLLQSAEHNARQAIQEGRLDEADRWLQWLENREDGIPLAAPLRLEWQERVRRQSDAGL